MNASKLCQVHTQGKLIAVVVVLHNNQSSITNKIREGESPLPPQWMEEQDHQPYLIFHGGKNHTYVYIWTNQMSDVNTCMSGMVCQL